VARRHAAEMAGTKAAADRKSMGIVLLVIGCLFLSHPPPQPLLIPTCLVIMQPLPTIRCSTRQ